MEPEILVNISMRLPQADRPTLAAALTPVIQEAIKLGGDKVSVNMQPYDPDGDD